MESVGRNRLSRAPHMKCKYLLPNGAQSIDKALGYFRRVTKQTDGSLVRAVANAREFLCGAMRILYTPCGPAGRGLSPPASRPEGLSNSLGALCALSRVVRGAARAETPFLRALDAFYGYLLNYSAPAPKGKAVVSSSSKPPDPDLPRSPTPAGAEAPSAKRLFPPSDDRAADRRPPHNRSPRGPRNYRGSRRASRRSRSRRPHPSSTSPKCVSVKSAPPLGRPVRTPRACRGICVRIDSWAPARTFPVTWVARAKTWATDAICRVDCRVAEATVRAVGPAIARQSARLGVYVNTIQSLSGS